MAVLCRVWSTPMAAYDWLTRICVLVYNIYFRVRGVIIVYEKKKKALGNDFIINAIIRFLPHNLIVSLTNIINDYLKICYFHTA